MRGSGKGQRSKSASMCKMALAIALGLTGVCATRAVSDELGLFDEQPNEAIELMRDATAQDEASATDEGIEVQPEAEVADDNAAEGSSETNEGGANEPDTYKGRDPRRELSYEYADREVSEAPFELPDGDEYLKKKQEFNSRGADTYLPSTPYVNEKGETKTAPICPINENTFEFLPGASYIARRDVELENRIEVKGDVRLIVADGMTTTFKKGIHCGKGSSLTIYGQAEGTGKIVAKGPDKCAGIGGDEGSDCGTITIVSGNIESEGGKQSAGIGGGYRGGCGTIRILGGNVAAKGKDNMGDNAGAGIGSGDVAEQGGSVAISGGKVVAVGRPGAAAIGSGSYAKAAVSIAVSGGTVLAKSEGHHGQGAIGSGTGTEAAVDVTITDGVVSSEGGGTGVAIGVGSMAYGGTVTISGGTVNAKGANLASGIGGGRLAAGPTSVTISGGNVNAAGGGGAAGISAGKGDCAGRVLITGGTVTATSDKTAYKESGAGIGTDAASNVGGVVIITGGTVNAKSAHSGAGIGSGDRAYQPIDVEISGGTVVAEGGAKGAGIGAGEDRSAGKVTITGDADVTAIGGNRAAGIGGGDDGNGGDVTIKSCRRVEATASGKQHAVAIGRGETGTDDGTLSLPEGYRVHGSWKPNGSLELARDDQRLDFPKTRACVVIEPGQQGVILPGQQRDVEDPSTHEGGDPDREAHEEMPDTYEGGDENRKAKAEDGDNGKAQPEEAGADKGDEMQPEDSGTDKPGNKDGKAQPETPKADKDDAQCEVTVCCIDADDNELAEELSAKGEKGQAIAATAPAIEGKTFQRWESADGDVLSYDRTLRTTLTGDANLIAVYGDEIEEARPTLAIGRLFRAEKDDVHGVGVQVTRYVPEGWELVEQGVLYARDFKGPKKRNFTLDTEGVTKQVSGNTEPNGTTRVIVSVANDNVKVTQRGYMKVKNLATGKEETLYTDLVTGAYSSKSTVNLVA